jgi:hypothetical protein
MAYSRTVVDCLVRVIRYTVWRIAGLVLIALLLLYAIRYTVWIASVSNSNCTSVPRTSEHELDPVLSGLFNRKQAIYAVFSAWRSAKAVFDCGVKKSYSPISNRDVDASAYCKEANSVLGLEVTQGFISHSYTWFQIDGRIGNVPVCRFVWGVRATFPMPRLHTGGTL